MRYFRYFPQITHNHKKMVDITKRVDVFKRLRQDSTLFLPYTVTGDMRPEDVAYHYYGDSGMVWLVYMANGIVDPYSEWVMPELVFQKYLAKKYKTQSGLEQPDEIVEWTMNETIDDNILYYEDGESVISVDTYRLGTSFLDDFTGTWRPVRVYEYEEAKNEAKRDIFLVNKNYAEQLKNELKDLLNG